MRILPLVFAATLATPAAADVTVRFIEGAPKDRFIIEAEGCAIGPHMLTIDLSPTAAGLIFDTDGSGPGVEVFQPFEIASGEEHVAHVLALGDGDNVLGLALTGLDVGDRVSFTIDLDDTMKKSALGQTRISNSEMMGAEVRVHSNEGEGGNAVFGADALARVPLLGCLS